MVQEFFKDIDDTFNTFSEEYYEQDFVYSCCCHVDEKRT